MFIVEGARPRLADLRCETWSVNRANGFSEFPKTNWQRPMGAVGKDTAETEVGPLNNSNRGGSRGAVDGVLLTEKQGRASFPPCWLGAG